jgi:hypothetical protein
MIAIFTLIHTWIFRAKRLKLVIPVLTGDRIDKTDTGCKFKRLVAMNALLLIISVLFISVAVIVVYLLLFPTVWARNITHCFSFYLKDNKPFKRIAETARQPLNSIVIFQPAKPTSSRLQLLQYTSPCLVYEP